MIRNDEKGGLSPLAERACRDIKKYSMIRFGDRVVVGLSGGPDSLCLLNVLAELRPVLGIRSLHAVHVNHGLRGEESDMDEYCAGKMAEEAGATFDSVKYDVRAMAEEQCTGEEEMGRRLRYSAFELYREKYGAQRIAIAHNMNDQAETVLMRIIRGTGIRGLSGIDRVGQDGVIIRPLLGFKREEIEEYCREKGLEPRIDSTNLKPIYTRNKIRLNLIPLLENEYNHRMQEALVRLAGQAGETDDFIRGAALDYIDGSGKGRARWDQDGAVLDTDGFSDLHPVVARRVILELLDRIGASHNVTADTLRRTARTAASENDSVEVDINGGCYARKAYGRLWFLRRGDEEGRQIKEALPLPADRLESEGRADIKAGGRLLRLSLTDRSGYRALRSGRRPDAPDGYIRAALDYDSLIRDGIPYFRNRRPGDRFRPIGMLGRKKLQDYFTDRKIPKQDRDTVILLALGGEVFLAGGEVGDACAITESTKRVLTVEY